MSEIYHTTVSTNEISEIQHQHFLQVMYYENTYNSQKKNSAQQLRVVAYRPVRELFMVITSAKRCSRSLKNVILFPCLKSLDT